MEIFITKKEWLEIGEKYFGAEKREWKFKCPACGFVQSVNSVKELCHQRGIDIQNLTWITVACAGREVEGVGCEYSLGGLINLADVIVIEGEKKIYTFWFANDEANAELIARGSEEIEVGKAELELRSQATKAASWSDFIWPDWVPEKLRAAISDFFSDDKPKRWVDNFRSNEPTLGAVVTLPALCSNETRTGRFLHLWNNIGAVIHEDKSFDRVYF